jgi:Cyclin M transmembrane N-terminal domain
LQARPIDLQGPGDLGVRSVTTRAQFMEHISTAWIWLGIAGCITLSGLFAGLNLAIFSLSQLRLQLEADGGNKDAARVLELRKNSKCWRR